MSVKVVALEDLAVRNTIRTPLDPLLHVLSRDYVNDKDLTVRLRKLFQVTVSINACKCVSCGVSSIV